MGNEKPKNFGIGNNNVRPMETQKPTAEPEDDGGFWKPPGSDLAAVKNWYAGQAPVRNAAPRDGFLGLLDRTNAAGVRPSTRYQDAQKDWDRAWDWWTSKPSPQPVNGRPTDEEIQFRDAQANIGNNNSVEDPATQSVAEWMAAKGYSTGGSGGSAGPDYSAYRASLTDQAQQTNAQIQAMYNQLAESAGSNVARLEDIYGGAQTGIGDVYGSASANTADAYGSSQQQATDQLARLGIEAAAPAVVNPMALSQAEALSGLEAGKAGGQAALERYGASAGGFGSQMAQVAQQQGTEMNSAVLNSLQNRLNDSLLMEEQGRQAAASSGGGGMSFSDQMRMQEQYNREVLGILPFEEDLALRKQGVTEGQSMADIQIGQERRDGELYTLLTTEGGMSREEAQAEIEWRRQSGLR